MNADPGRRHAFRRLTCSAAAIGLSLPAAAAGEEPAKKRRKTTPSESWEDDHVYIDIVGPTKPHRKKAMADSTHSGTSEKMPNSTSEPL